MVVSPRIVSTILSLIISGGLVAAAFYFSAPRGPEIVSAGATQELLKAYAKQDTDADGLFDWQEKLYGSDLANPNSLDPALTDKEAVDSGKVKPKFVSDQEALPLDEEIPGIPVEEGTLTERFGRQLFESYLVNQTLGPPTEEELLTFVESSIEELYSVDVAEPRYGTGDLSVVPGGEAALLTYASQVEAVGETSGQSGVVKSEIEYFADALYRSDASALQKVRAIGDTYQRLAEAYIRVPVPSEASLSHLKLANTLHRMGEVVSDMALFNEDPMRGLVGLGGYEAAAYEMADAFSGMHGVFTNVGVVIASGEPGYLFYLLMQTATEGNANR
ncbi:hypothetical protein L0Y34_01965 [Candidatus Parcubacteria bacterium]|nr:hypothetical protein [Candidatus Parcubacteria bacterium]